MAFAKNKTSQNFWGKICKIPRLTMPWSGSRVCWCDRVGPALSIEKRPWWLEHGNATLSQGSNPSLQHHHCHPPGDSGLGLMPFLSPSPHPTPTPPFHPQDCMYPFAHSSGKNVRNSKCLSVWTRIHFLSGIGTPASSSPAALADKATCWEPAKRAFF